MGLGPAPVHHAKKRLITEINMVPFIDVVLVLLIIFMILSPFLSQSKIPVNLPQVTTRRPADTDNPLKVQITKEGAIYVENRKVPADQLLVQLRLAVTRRADRTVLIEADREAAFKNVVMALDAAEKVGAAKVGVAVLAAPPSP